MPYGRYQAPPDTLLTPSLLCCRSSFRADGYAHTKKKKHYLLFPDDDGVWRLTSVGAVMIVVHAAHHDNKPNVAGTTPPLFSVARG